ncbi:MAG: 5'-3' exonuclease H3TH domain-containing protein, partial [Candidatus Paceibacterales bacterium]
YLALTGDAVDNIPGVPNVGPKTAAAWLAKYHSLDNLLQHAAEIPGKVGENLRNSIETVLLGRKLVTVKTDIPLSHSVTQLTPAASDNEMLKKIFTDLEFKNWLAELRETYSTEKNAAESKYTTILDQKTFQNWLGKLKRANAFAFDTETTNLDAMRAELVGLSFSIQANEAAYVPLIHDYLGAPQQLERDWVLAQLKPLFNDPEKLIIGQNLKYDLKILGHYGVTVSAKLWDSLLASYVVDGAAVRHDLDSLALRYLSYKTVSFEDIAGKGAKQLTFNKIPLEKAAFYAAEDADITFRLYQILNQKLESDGELKKIFMDIEMPLMPILMKMERHGVL